MFTIKYYCEFCVNKSYTTLFNKKRHFRALHWHSWKKARTYNPEYEVEEEKQENDDKEEVVDLANEKKEEDNHNNTMPSENKFMQYLNEDMDLFLELKF